MKSNIKISFWLNSAKTNKNRFAPIYVRVTDGQDYFTMTTGKYIKPSDWNKKTMKLKGISDEINSINEWKKHSN
jgi:predicted HAD superfamily Cof-like phosphohydrolase